MNRNTTFRRGIVCSAAIASSISLLIGCAGNGSGAAAPAKDISVTKIAPADSSRSLTVAPSAGANASVNNARDLAAAEPDGTFKNATRDLDLGGGGSSNAGALDYQSLGAALKQISPKTQDDQDHYILKVSYKANDGLDWDYSIWVSLSKDGSEIWLTSTFFPITGNADLLASLLSANMKMGAAFYAIDDNKTLVAMQSFSNIGVTPDVLIKNLKQFLTDLENSEPLVKPLIPQDNSGGGGNGGGSGGQNPFQ
jgi:hypothetical protein